MFFLPFFDSSPLWPSTLTHCRINHDILTRIPALSRCAIFFFFFFSPLSPPFPSPMRLVAMHSRPLLLKLRRS